MWINKEKWEALNKRIDDLEKKIPGAPSSEPLNFSVYDKANLMAYRDLGFQWREIPKQEISVKDAISKILDHLGLELAYVNGTPDAVVMQKIKIAKTPSK